VGTFFETQCKTSILVSHITCYWSWKVC